MGRKSRSKGQRGENEFAAFAGDRLGLVVKRRLGQERDGGHDVGVAHMAVQVKRSERLRPYDFLDQAVQDCPADMVPAVAVRSNGKGWLVMMDGEDWIRLVREALP